MFKFVELSTEAKKKAIKDYIDGWRETHEDDLAPCVVESLLKNNDDSYFCDGSLYFADGSLISEEKSKEIDAIRSKMNSILIKTEIWGVENKIADLMSMRNETVESDWIEKINRVIGAYGYVKKELENML